jgi:actin-related protein 2
MSKSIVLDSGTGNVKVGYAGANFPAATFPTVLGRPVLRAGKQQQRQAAKSAAAASAGQDKDSEPDLKDLMLGDETLGVRHLLECTMPINMGMVKKDAWDDMVLLWDYAFSKKLGEDTKQCRLSMSEAPMGGDPHRQKSFEIMFEHFGFQEVQSVSQGVLSLYSAGRHR